MHKLCESLYGICTNCFIRNCCWYMYVLYSIYDINASAEDSPRPIPGSKMEEEEIVGKGNNEHLRYLY